MAYDIDFAERLEALVGRDFAATGLLQRTTMFGGLGFLLDNKMCIHVFGDHLVLRVGLKNAVKLLELEHIEEMIHRKRPMAGWISIDTASDIDDGMISDYCALAVNFVMTLPIKKKKPKNTA